MISQKILEVNCLLFPPWGSGHWPHPQGRQEVKNLKKASLAMLVVFCGIFSHSSSLGLVISTKEGRAGERSGLLARTALFQDTVRAAVSHYALRVGTSRPGCWPAWRSTE